MSCISMERSFLPRTKITMHHQDIAAKVVKLDGGTITVTTTILMVGGTKS